jgi:hypothetical protein
VRRWRISSGNCSSPENGVSASQRCVCGLRCNYVVCSYFMVSATTANQPFMLLKQKCLAPGNSISPLGINVLEAENMRFCHRNRDQEHVRTLCHCEGETAKTWLVLLLQTQYAGTFVASPSSSKINFMEPEKKQSRQREVCYYRSAVSVLSESISDPCGSPY